MQWFRQHKSLSLLLTIVCLMAILLLSSSQLSILALRSFLNDHASDVSIGRLELNLWRSQLRIDDLKLKDQDGNRLGFKHFYVDWNTLDLWHNNLTVHTLELDGLTVDLNSDNWQLTDVGPFNLADFQSETSEPSGEPWSLHISGIGLTRVELCLNDASLTFEQIGIPLTQAQPFNSCLGFDSFQPAGAIHVDGSAFSYQGPVNGHGIVWKTGQILLASLEQFSLFPLTLSPASVNTDQLHVRGLMLLANPEQPMADAGAALDSLNMDGVKFLPEASSVQVTTMDVYGSKVWLRAADEELHSAVELEQLTIKDLSATAEQQLVTRLSMANLKLFDDYQQRFTDKAHHFSLGSAEIDNVQLTDTGLAISKIGLLALDAVIGIDQTGHSLSDWFETVVNEPEASASEAMAIRLDQVLLNGDSSVQFEDLRLNQPIIHRLSEIELAITNLSVGEKSLDTTETDIKYAMGVGDSGRLTGEGSALLETSQLNLNLTGQLTNINLSDFSDYAARAIGYRVDQGLLNMHYRLVLDDNSLDANLDTHLEKFYLGTLQAHEKHPLNESLGMPLSTALDLLRDGDDAIKLDLPVKGDIHDPKFSMASVFSIVMTKAIKQAVIMHYSPLGMLTLATGILDLATALRFDPVLFQSTSVEIDEPGRKRLQKVIDLMSKKPKVKMVICGVGTLADWTTNIPPNEQEKLGLIELAKDRQQVVIDYLVDKGDIARERLVGCNVRLSDKADLKPQVKLSI